MSTALAEKTTTSFHVGHRGAGTDETVGSLFQPDSLLLEQYLDTTRRKIVLQPEKRLMLAILKDAVSTFQTDLFAANVKSSRRFEQAKDWISETDGDWVFSFQNICECLGLNPAYVRNGLLHWMEKRLAKRQLDTGTTRKKMVG
jgi:peptidyl-tRNA hydrolase